MYQRFLFLLLFLSLTMSLSAQGPWAQPQGKGFYKLSEWWTRFDEHFTSQGKTDPNLTTGVYNTTIYAEYGVSDRLTAIVNFPFFSRNTMNNLISEVNGETLVPGEAINGFGDAEIAAKYTFTPQGAKVPIAISLTLGLPLGEDAGGTQGNLQLGDGEFNQLIQGHIGSSFRLGNSNAYWAVLLGINNRTQGFSDEFRWGLEGGINFAAEKLWLIGRVRAVHSFFNGETAAGNTSTSIFANNIEFISPGLELNYYLTPKLGVSAGVAGAITGRLVAASPGYTFGVFLDVK
ncbi:MAG: hypothetical protein AAGF87_05745 [Bacteroidota bacterium]